MKKLFFFAAAVIMMAAGCQKQEFNPLTDGDTAVTFKVSAGDVLTKAIADATNIDALHWEIYAGQGDKVLAAAGPLGKDKIVETDGDKTFTLTLKLLADQEYTLIFWAEKDGAGHYLTDDLRSVKINDYSDEKANDESRAAFFAVYPFETENGKAINETVTLYRPFSQINLGATTLETSFNKVQAGTDLVVSSSQMTVTSIATSFNTLTGKGEGEQAVTFASAAIPNDTEVTTDKELNVKNDTYYWLGMNYLIVNGDTDNVVVDFTIATNLGDVSHSVTNVPVKENHRTNILGNILTVGAKFTVEIDEDFQTPDYNVSTPAEYELVSEGLYIDELGAYHVTSKAGLESFSNKTVDNGTVINLDADIDFESGEFKAIAAGYSKSLTFNGNGHTISNVKLVSCSHNSVGAASLFFCYPGGIIRVRDLIVDNAQSEGATYVGAILGYTQGDALLSNITVKNSSISGAKKVGGLVGFVEASTSSFIAEDCTVENTTVTATEKQAGTILGYNAMPATLKNCTAVSSSATSPLYCDGGIRSTDPVQAELTIK